LTLTQENSAVLRETGMNLEKMMRKDDGGSFQ